MNITVVKIKKTLVKDYGWDNLDAESQKWFIDGLLKDTLSIIDNELKFHKGISIKKQ